jgi:hypothetical protein
MMDYSKGKIYLIRNKINENFIYVGSTIEEYLLKRFNKHKYQKCCSLNKYVSDENNNSNWNDWYIELYENFPCNSKGELCKKGKWNNKRKSNNNKIGYSTDEMKKEQDKQYRINNKEKIEQEKYIMIIIEKKFYKRNKNIMITTENIK